MLEVRVGDYHRTERADFVCAIADGGVGGAREVEAVVGTEQPAAKVAVEAEVHGVVRPATEGEGGVEAGEVEVEVTLCVCFNQYGGKTAAVERDVWYRVFDPRGVGVPLRGDVGDRFAVQMPVPHHQRKRAAGALVEKERKKVKERRGVGAKKSPLGVGALRTPNPLWARKHELWFAARQVV